VLMILESISVLFKDIAVARGTKIS